MEEEEACSETFESLGMFAAAFLPPLAAGPGWMVLDRFIHRSRRCRGIIVDQGNETVSELSFDCVGRPIRASLRLADPPPVSRLHLHQMGRPPIKAMEEPAAIAAHHHATLFEVTVAFDNPDMLHLASCFTVNYFVYSSATSPPSLTRLTPCFQGITINPKVDAMYQRYRNQRQRTMLERDMGILCHNGNGVDDDELTFMVADLGHRDQRHIELCILHHHHPRSKDHELEWKVKKMPIRPSLIRNLRSFWLDTVVAVDERRLCQVDYY